MASKDNIIDLLEVIESQKFSYFLVIISPKSKVSTQDELEIFHNLGDDSIDKLYPILKKANITKNNRKDKDKKNNKEKIDNEDKKK